MSLSKFTVFLMLTCLGSLTMAQVPTTKPGIVIPVPPANFAEQKIDLGGENFTWGDAPIHDFGPREVKFDFSGMRSLRSAPPYGVHPRIYLSPEDIPDLRKHLAESETGKLTWKFILAWTENMKGRYDAKADYNFPTLVNFGPWHTTVPMYRMGEVKPEMYQGLIHGDKTVMLPGCMWGAMAAEALRCLVANDEKSAHDLAAAAITVMKMDQEKRAEENAKKNYSGPPDMPVGGADLAHIYDLIFKWLTPEQRQAMHDELAWGSWHDAHYGNFETAVWARSTWATFCHHILPLMAIEGEPGCNMIKLDACYRSWRNYITYSINRSGCIYEGEGKLVLGAGGIMALTQRPRYECLGAHPNLRRWADFFLPHSANSAGDGFLGFDLLANAHGRPNSVDIMLMRYLYPEDKRIEWAYREVLGPNYERLPSNVQLWAQMNNLIFSAVFATDYSKEPIDPEQLGLGHTFFDGERSLVMSRSDWSRQGLQFTMQTRAVSGGHPYADRNSIQVIGAGRVWSSVNGGEMYENRAQSIVIVDDTEQSIDVPGRFVDFKDKVNATFVVGDAKYNWDWKWDKIDYNHKPAVPGWDRLYTVEEGKAGVIEKSVRPFEEPEFHCAADFHLTNQDDPAERIPLSRRPFWMLGKGVMDPVARIPNYPVQRAFRTAGIVRGVHPYLLILDDIQKDNYLHHYDWILQLEPDLKIASTGSLKADAGVCDIRLQSDGSFKDNPAPDSELLIRVLQRNQDFSHPLETEAAFISDIKAGKFHKAIHRLVIPTNSIAPDYKILIYAHKIGTPLPQTIWDKEGTKLVIKWADQEDTVFFAKQAMGKTDLTMQRASASPMELIKLNAPIQPLPDATIEAEQKANRLNEKKARSTLADYSPTQDNDLIGYWKFAQIEMNKFRDASKAHLEIPASGIRVVDSPFGHAAQFEGNLEGAVLPLAALSQKGPFTVMFWVKAPGIRNGNLISLEGNHGIRISALWGNINCFVSGPDWKAPVFPCSFLADWHALAFSWDGTQGAYYYDGKLVFQGVCPMQTQQIRLGGRQDQTDFRGMISELMIFHRALRQDEIYKINSWEKYVLAKNGWLAD